MGEPLSCITHALDVTGQIEVGKKILIIGAGIIGLLWSCFLHFMGHRRVFVVQRSVKRRESFVKLGKFLFDTAQKEPSTDLLHMNKKEFFVTVNAVLSRLDD